MRTTPGWVSFLAILGVTACVWGCASIGRRAVEAPSDASALAQAVSPAAASPLGEQMELNALYDDENNELRFVARFHRLAGSEPTLLTAANAVQFDGVPVQIRLGPPACGMGACYVFSRKLPPQRLKESYALQVREPGAELSTSVRLPRPVKLNVSHSTLIFERPELFRVSWPPFEAANDETLNLVASGQAGKKTFPVSPLQAKQGELSMGTEELRELGAGSIHFQFVRSRSQPLQDEAQAAAKLDIVTTSETRRVFAR